MSKRFILSPLFILLILLAGYEFYTSAKGRDFLTAAHLVDGLAFAAPIKMQVVDFYSMQGELPVSNADLGLPPPQSISNRSVKSVEVSQGGKITIVYNNALKKDSSIILVPSTEVGYSTYGIKWSCLSESVEQSHFDTVSMPCSYVAPSAISKLLDSIATSNEAKARAAMLAGANVNGVLRGDTPLFSAIARDQYFITQQLISAGADVNQKSSVDPKITPLMHAVVLDKQKMAALLLEHGANIDATDRVGKTALMYAIEKGRKNIVELLLSHGANPLLKNSRGKDAAYYAKRYKRHKGIISELLEAATQSYVAARPASGVSDLMRAASDGNMGKIRKIINAGAALDAVDSFNATALHYALQSQQAVTTNLLIESGVAVNGADRDGDTPLMLAVKNGRAEIVGLLLQSGAKINIENKYQQTPFLMAVRYGYVEIVELLMNAGATESINKALYETFFSPAPKQQSIDIQKLILGAGLKIDSDAENMALLLVKSVQEGRIPVTRFLLSHDVNLAIDAEDLLLHVAVKSVDYEMIALLVEHGENINAVTSTGKTALMFAVKSRNIRLVKYLLSLGASVGATDENGLSALRMAKANFSEEMVELLRRHKK